MYEEERDEEGISLLELLKVAFGRKILLLIITLSITIIGLIFVKFYYNQNKQQYYVNYEYVMPGIEEGKYIDDSKFNYQMLVSPSSLQIVKESDEDFKNIDIEKMMDKDAIQVYCDITRNQANEIEKVSYKLVANVKYFKNSKQANKFIHAVADQPYTKTISLLDTIKYDSFLDNYKNSNIYDTKADCLISQYNLLQTQYSDLMKRYGDVTLSDGKKLSYYLDELKVYFKENSLNNLLTEIQKNGYVKDYSTYEVELKTTWDTLDKNYALNEEKITALKAVISDISSSLQQADLNSYNEIISRLTVENVEINSKKAIIEAKLSNKGNTDPDYIEELVKFNSRIENYEQKLEEYTESFKNNVKEVVNEGSYVSYSNNNVKVQGGIKILIAGPALLVLGCFVGCIVNICLDYKKLSKKEETNKPAENE